MSSTGMAANRDESFRLPARWPSAPGRDGTDAESSGPEASLQFSAGRRQPECRQPEGSFLLTGRIFILAVIRELFTSSGTTLRFFPDFSET